MSTTTKAVPQETNWSLSQVWNNIAMKPDRPLVKREYCYASELGAPFYDRYLKMNAVPYTNPPNDRSRRKFLAGNLGEYLVKQILIAAGVYSQDEVKVDARPYSHTLEVHGRCDFKTAKGYVNIEEALNRLQVLALPDYLYFVGKGIITSLNGVYLKEKILELKSISSFAMDRVERIGIAMPQHTLQSYHYQKNTDIEASLCYCCKDDLRMRQFGVISEFVEPLYKQDLEQMTVYFTKRIEPPKERLVKWDDLVGRFSKSLGVEYSVYLSHYGFDNPDAYRQHVSYVEKWNRCLARFVLAETGHKTPNGKPMQLTPKNKEVRLEIERMGYDFNYLIETKIRLGATEDEEEIE